MLAQEHHLPVVRTARYYQVGEISASTRRLWVVAHGYGQLAAYFIRHFAPLAATAPDLVVLAPEGLSRFYLQGTNGRIGATWMTREDRLTEINDYVAYLNQLVEVVLPQAAPDVAVTVLGFSQGAATVCRWLTQARFRPVQLVLWAGAFPPDMDFDVATHFLQDLPVTLICGTEDEFITEEDLEQQRHLFRHVGVEPTILRFAGKHTLNAAVLAELNEAQLASRH
ncbi:phospholipase [Hymenobacter sp. 5516J-16]|uniref:Phospholipase n=1 Tax=Hymenobacter sublimis TaxID=2933777 RepID=A0ABY4JFE8_9BACT|nr:MULTISPECIES: phospholipase [Hymenobacter]UOQ77004.1 phospholipase [Hymenobacter sp. 5516J-16]UPL50689.1 phospholipase [Hymenobacter sublimis]